MRTRSHVPISRQSRQELYGNIYIIVTYRTLARTLDVELYILKIGRNLLLERYSIRVKDLRRENAEWKVNAGASSHKIYGSRISRRRTLCRGRVRRKKKTEPNLI